MQHTQLSHTSLSQLLQHPKRATTLRRVRQDKVAPTCDRVASSQPAPLKNRTRTHYMDTIVPRPQNYFKKRSKKRQTVPITIWASVEEKKELLRLADSEGLTLSRTGRAILVDGLVQKLRMQREVLATPALEATIHKEMSRLINNLSQFQGRIVFETGQIRWLFINKLYREVTHPNKTLTKEEFYKLLDASSKETRKNLHRFIPEIAEVIDAVKKWLRREEENT